MSIIKKMHTKGKETLFSNFNTGLVFSDYVVFTGIHLKKRSLDRRRR